jgi:hypothetical protein
MEKYFGIIVSVMILSAAFCCAEPAVPEESVLNMKSGNCSFKILESSGIKPMKDIPLKLLSAESGKKICEAVTDTKGVCSVEVEKGRYILQVNNMNLTVLVASGEAKISECRIIVPEKAMTVAAQDPNPAVAGGVGTILGIKKTTVFMVGGVAVLAGGVVAAANDDSSTSGSGSTTTSASQSDAASSNSGNITSSKPKPASP